MVVKKSIYDLILDYHSRKIHKKYEPIYKVVWLIALHLECILLLNRNKSQQKVIFSHIFSFQTFLFLHQNYLKLFEEWKICRPLLLKLKITFRNLSTLSAYGTFHNPSLSGLLFYIQIIRLTFIHTGAYYNDCYFFLRQIKYSGGHI